MIGQVAPKLIGFTKFLDAIPWLVSFDKGNSFILCKQLQGDWGAISAVSFASTSQLGGMKETLLRRTYHQAQYIAYLVSSDAQCAWSYPVGVSLAWLCSDQNLQHQSKAD